tara:strand:- start:59 stop:304 length:246 start_codon:yes stop_codon:yes gene_type:complete
MSNQDKTVIDRAIARLAADSNTQELVQKVESDTKTTAGHYGRYLSLLLNIKDKNIRYILSQAFIKAGADPYGVNSAMKIIG